MPSLIITKDIIVLILMENISTSQRRSPLDGSKTFKKDEVKQIIFKEIDSIYLEITINPKTRINLFFNPEQWNFIDWNLDPQNKILNIRSQRIIG